MISLPNVNLLSWLLTLRMVATQRLQLFNDIKSHVLKRELWMPCEGNPGSRGVDADPIAACPWHVRSFAPSTMSPLWSHACCHTSQLSSPQFCTLGTFFCSLSLPRRGVWWCLPNCSGPGAFLPRHTCILAATLPAHPEAQGLQACFGKHFQRGVSYTQPRPCRQQTSLAKRLI